MFMINANSNMITNRTFDRWFIYSSNRPIFVDASLEFIFDLVYFPVKTTRPIMEPAATTVLAQAVLSKLSDYFFPSLLIKLPKKS